MAGVDNICLDKTGVMTKNAMKVTNIWCGKDIELSMEMNEDGNIIDALTKHRTKVDSNCNH